MYQSYDIKNLFGKKVKSLRIKSGLTQSQLAESINVDPKHISCIENGKNFPSASVISTLAETLNVHPKNLFEFENEPSQDALKKELLKTINAASKEQLEKIFIYAKYTTNC